MMIREMSREECFRALARVRLTRLACAHDNQPYVVPVYLACHEASACLYGFTTPGQKVEWMRTNPLVCVELEEVVAYDQWISVVAMGCYEELPQTPENEEASHWAQEPPKQGAEAMPDWASNVRQSQCEEERGQAWQFLKALPVWWQPGSAAWAARAHRGTAEPFISVYYRIRINQVTGHEATRDASNGIADSPLASSTEKWGGLLKSVARIFGARSK